MRNILTLVLFLLTFQLFGQTPNKQSYNYKPYYSDSSRIKIIYTDSLNDLNSDKKPAAFFVNGAFIENDIQLSIINPKKIEKIEVEKENFEINGKEYYGKIIIEMKSGHSSKFLTIKELTTKYCFKYKPRYLPN